MYRKGLFTALPLLVVCGMTAFISCDDGSGPNLPAKAIEVLSPKGGETYTVGQVVEIKWRINDFNNIVSIGVKLSIDRGKSYDYIPGRTSSFPLDTMSYNWTVEAASVSNQCKIEVYEYNNASIHDTSGVFAIKN